MAGLSGKVGAVYVQTVDASTAFTNAAMTANATYDRYTITDSAKRFWDKNTAVVVKVNGGTVTTGYTIEYPGGVIVFETPLIDTDTVTASGSFWTMEQVGGFFSWSLDISRDMQDTPEFGSAWKTHEPIQGGFSGSAEKYWGDERFLSAVGTEVAIALYVDASDTQTRYEGYAVISGDGIEAAADSIINETIDFQGNGQLYFRP